MASYATDGRRSRKLTPGDAMLIGAHVSAFRRSMSGLTGKQLRKQALLKLWHMQQHRLARGADNRWFFEMQRAIGVEALRLSRINGCVLP